jgi:hypothetical protein
MASIDKLIIERIIERADIVDVVGAFVQLTKKRVRYLGLCPFHDDKRLGSFVVYPKYNCFRCFSCEKKGDSVTFLMEHCHINFVDAIRWLGARYGIPVDDVPADFVMPPPRPPMPALPTLELPMTMVTSREKTEHDTLCRWLRSLNWDGAQRARVEQVLTEYHVGHSRTGHTMFWQIDENGKVRTGKMMLYYPEGHEKWGKRDKESKYNFDWIHAVLFRDARQTDYDPERVEVHPCLFGLHLLDRYPNADVNVVESEKTALIMAIAYGNHERGVWMACGGLSNISREKLLPLINARRNIILYPDRDGVKAWKEKAQSIGYDLLRVNSDPVLKWWEPRDGEKADIADIIINRLNK